jgi:hypothetical protein
MAIQLRRADVCDYCLAVDPSTVSEGKTLVAGVAVDAAGQPADATRFGIAPLDTIAYGAWINAEAAEDRFDAAWKGVQSIDGVPQDWRPLPATVTYAVCNLVIAISSGVGSADPLDVPSSSTAKPSRQTRSSKPSQTSRSTSRKPGK